MELSKQSKTRKPNWSESELHALTQGVSENINIIRGKFGPSLTSETKNKCWLKIRECVNSVNPSAVQRDMAEVKKKWQDIQSIAKKKEAARVKSARSTGGGPPPEDFSKPWEQVVIGTLTKSMVEGIEGGEDTSITDRIINSDCVNIEEENVLDSDPVEVITVQNIKPVKEIKKTTSKRGNSTCTETAAETHFFELEEAKQIRMEKYRAKKIKIMEEMLELQRRQTKALEDIRASLHVETAFSISPIINMSET